MEFGWLNLFGLIIILLILIPNIIYALRNKNQQNKCKNMFMNILEQIGRYGCMLLMVVHLGIKKLGFGSVDLFMIYFLGNICLILAYWIIWALFLRKPAYRMQIALAVIPTCIFLLCGLTMRHWLLVVFAVIFGIGHIYVTNKNRV